MTDTPVRPDAPITKVYPNGSDALIVEVRCPYGCRRRHTHGLPVRGQLRNETRVPHCDQYSMSKKKWAEYDALPCPFYTITDPAGLLVPHRPIETQAENSAPDPVSDDRG